MSWHIEMYDRLRSERLIERSEHGTLPAPAEVADAMEQCADRLERDAMNAGHFLPVGVGEMRWLAAKIRDGPPAGRHAFWSTLVYVIDIKRGTKPPGMVTLHLPAETLAPFGSSPVDVDVAYNDFTD